MRDYTKIVAWQKTDNFTVAVYEATCGFPREELYGLTSQLRRAAYSVPANIVEGASRSSQKDYLHFLYVARGSLNEARYFLHLACRLGFLAPSIKNELETQAEEASRTLAGLIRAVEQEAGGVSRTVARLSIFIILSVGVWIR